MKKKVKRVHFKYGLLVDSKYESHNPTAARIDSRLDWLENKNGIGSLGGRFTVLDFGPNQFKLFGSDTVNGAGIFIDKPNNKIRYKNTNGTLTTEVVFDAVLDAGINYSIAFVKIGETARCLINNQYLPISSQAASGLDRVTANPFTFGSNAVFIANNLFGFSTEIDRKGGAPFMGYIEGIDSVGNWVHSDLAPYVVAHYPIQESGGAFLYDCVKQYNPWKSKFLPDLKLANWNKVTSSEVTFNEGADYIGATVTGTIPASPGWVRPSLYTNTFNVYAGKTYTMVFDIEIFASAPGQVSIACFKNYADAGSGLLNFSTPGRERKTITFTMTDDRGDAWYIEPYMYETGAKFKVYEAKLYETAIGAPLEANHIQLIGYDATEKGETNGVSTVRKDIFTKQTANIFQVDGSGDAIYTNGVRTEIASGLPELKSAIFTRGSSEIWMPSIPTIPLYGDFSFQIAWYNPGTPMPSVPNEAIIYNSTALNVTADNRTVRVFAGNDLVEFDFHTVGFNSVTFSRSGGQAFIAYNHARKDKVFNEVHVGFFDNTLELKTTPGGVMRFLGVAGSGISEMGVIAAAYNGFGMTIRQHLEFHKNGLLGNLNPLKMLWGVNCNNVNGSNQLIDLSGNGNHFNTYYTTNQMNPAHAEYAFKTIDSLR